MGSTIAKDGLIVGDYFSWLVPSCLERKMVRFGAYIIIDLTETRDLDPRYRAIQPILSGSYVNDRDKR